MSFPRAKRFNYKTPDITVSPADYYISSSNGKPFKLSKCERYSSRHEQLFSVCKRENTKSSKCQEKKLKGEDALRTSPGSFQNPPHASSTPRIKQISAPEIDNVKDEVMRFSRYDNNRVSFRTKLNKVNLKTSSKEEDKPLIKIEEQFIDDDYYSYISYSDEENLNGYVCEPQKTAKFYNRFLRKNVINRIQNTNKIIERYQKSSKQLLEDIKAINKTNATLDDDKFRVYKAVDDLRNEFENKHNLLHSKVVRKIDELAREIYRANKKSKTQMDRVSDNAAASSLGKEMLQFLRNDVILEQPTTSDDGSDEEFFSFNGEYFNYENVCRILSDRLQLSYRELDELNREKSYVFNKCKHLQKVIQAQTKLINEFKEDLTKLKSIF